MIRVKTCFVAEGVTADRESGQISAFGLVDRLDPEGYPLWVQKLVFFCQWARATEDPQRATCEFSITLNGQDMMRQSVDIDFQQYLYGRTTIKLNGFTLNEPGIVVFRLAIPGHDTAEWTMEASRAAPAAPGIVGPTEPSRIYDSGQVSVSVGSVNVNRR